MPNWPAENAGAVIEKENWGSSLIDTPSSDFTRLQLPPRWGFEAFEMYVTVYPLYAQLETSKAVWS